MRIIGGTAAGRIIKAPKGLEVRPTPDRVRQAIFNRLGESIAGTRVLELFGGTGALSLESLSRGAKSSTCVELSRKHARFIEQNAKVCGFPPGSLQLCVEDVFHALARFANSGRQFDFIMADPPFGEKNVGRRSTSFSQKLLDDENLPQLLAEDGQLILGHTRRDTLDLPAQWHEDKLMKHGDSQFRFLHHSS